MSSRRVGGRWPAGSERERGQEDTSVAGGGCYGRRRVGRVDGPFLRGRRDRRGVVVLTVEETGFLPVPWFMSDPALTFVSLDELPPVVQAEMPVAECCPAEGPDGYGCTRPVGHAGTHRAGDGISVLAEWWW